MPAILIFSQVSPSHCGHFAWGLTGGRGQGTTVTETKCGEKALEEMVILLAASPLYCTHCHRDRASSYTEQANGS